MVKLIGKYPINPFLFITGKISGYLTWVIVVLHLFGYEIMRSTNFTYSTHISYAIFGLGAIVVAMSLFNLGKSTSLGIPSENTMLKSTGLYRFSRNPMYVGFNIMTLSSILLTLNIVVAILSIYSVVVYHFIIIGEERFLSKRFGKQYDVYSEQVRRYF